VHAQGARAAGGAHIRRSHWDGGQTQHHVCLLIENAEGRVEAGESEDEEDKKKVSRQKNGQAS
jgi:hypothetical protein